MENASKALIIAGSILIVILLIAMGMRVFNSTSGTADSVEGTMQSTEIMTFNNKFIQYAGEKKSVAQVKSLANLVIAHNATNPNEQVRLMGSYDAAAITNYAAGLSTSKSYTVSLGYNSAGKVNDIIVKDSGTTIGGNSPIISGGENSGSTSEGTGSSSGTQPGGTDSAPTWGSGENQS